MTEAADILQRYWGYDSFRPLQQEIIESVLSGHDTIALLPTGGGKSITFQVPALMMDGITLVVTPLISLMKDQVDNLRQVGVPAVCIHSGMTRGEQRLALDKARLGKAKLVYLSPERISRDSFQATMAPWNVAMIVVDEAHCISQWGYDFRPNYLKIATLRRHFPDAVMMALTASATPEVVDDIITRLEMRQPRRFARSFRRDNISYLVRRGEDKEGMMMHILRNTAGTAIVYVRSRKRAREIAALISASGISADYYHAGLAPEEKTQRQNTWKAGEVRVIVATNAFGMGIDKPDVRLVVHYDLPPSLEEYYQEAGRAGRDGLPSYAVLLVSKFDKGLLHRRLTDSFPPKDEIIDVYDRLGVWLNLAVDDGFNQVFDCNIDRFTQFCGRTPARVRSALGILSLSGYIDYVDDNASLARVMILIDKEHFYSLRLDPVTDTVFQCLLRKYTGLFADYVTISEESLALQADCTTEQVYEALLTLSREKVLSYIPRRLEPYVYYAQRRQLKRYIVIPQEVYEHRLERARRRVDSMIAYAYDDSRCRVRGMLEYFGDREAGDCGKCDYCRARRNGGRTRQLDIDTVRADVDAVLAFAGGPVGVGEYLDRWGSHREAAADCLSRLRELGEVRIEAMMIVKNG